jgi:urease accessory protein
MTRKNSDASRRAAPALRSGIAPARVDAPRSQSDEDAAATAMTAERVRADLFRLMTWLSPSFPVGSFSYSSGIEWAVEVGDIRDAASLGVWLALMLANGPGASDGILLGHAYRAARASDRARLAEVAELAAALGPSRERHLETTMQGRAFLDAIDAAWGCAALDQLREAWDGPVAYPIAVGVAGAGHGIDRDDLVHAYLHALTANWISAGVRLIPLGQSDSQRVLASLEATIASTAARAGKASLDEIGGATIRADLSSMRHETQYTRLFRT